MAESLLIFMVPFGYIYNSHTQSTHDSTHTPIFPASLSSQQSSLHSCITRPRSLLFLQTSVPFFNFTMWLYGIRFIIKEAHINSGKSVWLIIQMKKTKQNNGISHHYKQVNLCAPLTMATRLVIILPSLFVTSVFSIL